MRPLHIGSLLALGAALVVSARLGAAYVHAGRQSNAPSSLVMTHAGKLLLTDGGSSQQLLTGLGPGRSTYPWYAWSPDGQYLLIVRVASPPSTAWNLLILSANGRVVRQVRDAQPAGGFYPNWAMDADRVAYLSKRPVGSGQSTVRWTDPQGESGVLVSFAAQAGCGGGGADPAEMAYQEQTADGGMMFPLQWSVKQHSALLWIGSGTSLIDTRTGVAHHLGTSRQQIGDAVLSTTGHIAAVLQACNKAGCTSRIVLIDPATLRMTRDLGSGELPAWSQTGQSLYFIRRVQRRTLTLVDTTGNSVPSTVYRTSIWRVDAAGQHAARLIREDAYGFGLLNVAPDGTLVFSRVDNATLLWQHRLKNGRFDSTLLKRYGPRVAVQQLSPRGDVTTLAVDSGLPSVQP